MSRKAIYMDTSICVECQACRVACQMQNGLKPELVYIKFTGVEQGQYPATTYTLVRKSCNHCGKPPCVDVCPVNAITRGNSGFTHLDVEKCIGCGMCVSACPFGVPEIKDSKSIRCAGCPDLVEANRPPACVDTCITNALKFGDRTAMVADGEKRAGQLQKTHPDAVLYGKEANGGLGVLQVLRAKPGVYNLPA